MNPLPSRDLTWNIKSYFLWDTMKKYLWMSSVAVVIGALRIKFVFLCLIFNIPEWNLLIQSDLDMWKSKFIQNFWYLELNFLVPENFLGNFSILDNNSWNVNKLGNSLNYILWYKRILLRYLCLRYQETLIQHWIKWLEKNYLFEKIWSFCWKIFSF